VGLCAQDAQVRFHPQSLRAASSHDQSVTCALFIGARALRSGPRVWAVSYYNTEDPAPSALISYLLRYTLCTLLPSCWKWNVQSTCIFNKECLQRTVLILIKMTTDAKAVFFMHFFERNWETDNNNTCFVVIGFLAFLELVECVLIYFGMPRPVAHLWPPALEDSAQMLRLSCILFFF
jgi:hypothetical protein